MRKNRLTNAEVQDLITIVNNMDDLIQMRACEFRNDETVRVARVKSWIQWFDVERCKLLDMLRSDGWGA